MEEEKGREEESSSKGEIKKQREPTAAEKIAEFRRTRDRSALGGRPTKLTPETAAIIVELMSDCLPMSMVAEGADISEPSLRLYLSGKEQGTLTEEQYSAFLLDASRARHKRKLALVRSWQKVALGNPRNVIVGKNPDGSAQIVTVTDEPDWKATQAYLSRVDPSFREEAKLELEHTIKPLLSKFTDDELDNHARQLAQEFIKRENQEKIDAVIEVDKLLTEGESDATESGTQGDS